MGIPDTKIAFYKVPVSNHSYLYHTLVSKSNIFIQSEDQGKAGTGGTVYYAAEKAKRKINLDGCKRLY